MFGRMVFYLQFLHYIFFLISITSYILIKLTFDSYQRQLDKNEANATKCIQDQDDQNKMTLLGLRIAVFVAVIIAGVIEISLSFSYSTSTATTARTSWTLEISDSL